MNTTNRSLIDWFTQPDLAAVSCGGYILLYYTVSCFSLRAHARNNIRGAWRRNGPVDLVTTGVTLSMGLLMCVNLVGLTSTHALGLWYLLVYYIEFIFLFGFGYGLAEWHAPGMLCEVMAPSWKAELQYILVSAQTQTTLGYTRARPGRLLTEVLACLQAMLGWIFGAIFVAKAVDLWILK